MKKIFLIILLFILIISLEFSFERFKKFEASEDLLYFPKGSNVKFIVSGYEKIVADLLWIRGGIYYGEEKIKNGSFEYLFHIYDIVTSLDERFLNAYIFGAFFINYQLDNLELSIRLIDKGINRLPEEWVLHFYKGFMYYISYDFEKAYKSFIVGSLFEKGSDRCKKFALMSLIKEQGVKNILYYWIEFYSKSKNVYMKEIAIDGIKEAIKFAMKRFERDKGRTPENIYELLKESYIPFIPQIEEKPFRIQNGEVLW